MTTIRWDPLHNVSALQDRINRMFDDAFPRSRDTEDDLSVCDWKPPVDIYETQDALIILVELPGIDKEDVTVEIKDNVLSLRGTRNVDKSIPDSSYLRRERCTGTFSRSFNLRHNIKPDSIRARFKNGILEVTVPKPEEERPRQVTVNVE